MAESAAVITGQKRRPMPPVEHQFKVGNPGRPKGSRNKLGEAFVEALADDFAKHGVAAIEAVREEKPDVYLKVIATVIPKEVHHTVEDDLSQLSDDELHARFLAAAARLGTNGGNARRAGETGKSSSLPN